MNSITLFMGPLCVKPLKVEPDDDDDELLDMSILVWKSKPALACRLAHYCIETTAQHVHTTEGESRNKVYRDMLRRYAQELFATQLWQEYMQMYHPGEVNEDVLLRDLKR